MSRRLRFLHVKSYISRVNFVASLISRYLTGEIFFRSIKSQIDPIAFSRSRNESIVVLRSAWIDEVLDFLSTPNEDLDDLEISDAQRGHALAIERLAPSFCLLHR
ncbi:Uncharacterized protein Rs2_09014 [Raphanus sativus]|nr:Uncharacterized protein Rs2_09014 [Raphanus sativus]